MSPDAADAPASPEPRRQPPARSGGGGEAGKIGLFATIAALGIAGTVAKAIFKVGRHVGDDVVRVGGRSADEIAGVAGRNVDEVGGISRHVDEAGAAAAGEAPARPGFLPGGETGTLAEAGAAGASRAARIDAADDLIERIAEEANEEALQMLLEDLAELYVDLLDAEDVDESEMAARARAAQVLEAHDRLGPDGRPR